MKILQGRFAWEKKPIFFFVGRRFFFFVWLLGRTWWFSNTEIRWLLNEWSNSSLPSQTFHHVAKRVP